VWCSGTADTSHEVLPTVGQLLLGMPGGAIEIGCRQVEQERAVQGRGELDGQQVEVGGAEVDLLQEYPDMGL